MVRSQHVDLPVFDGAPQRLYYLGTAQGWIAPGERSVCLQGFFGQEEILRAGFDGDVDPASPRLCGHLHGQGIRRVDGLDRPPNLRS